MSTKLLKILKMISEDHKELEFDSEEVFEAIDCDESDLTDICEELEGLEFSGKFDENSLDILKAILVYILIRDSSYEKEDVFSLIFGGGKRILWN